MLSSFSLSNNLKSSSQDSSFLVQEFYQDWCRVCGTEDVSDMLSFYSRKNCSGPGRAILHCTAKFFREGPHRNFPGVGDPGYLSRILDPNFFPPGSRLIKILGSRIRIHIKVF
jgi:hypothetical protein